MGEFLVNDRVKLTERYANTLQEAPKRGTMVNWRTRQGFVVSCGRCSIGIQWPGRRSIDYFPRGAIEKIDDDVEFSIVPETPLEGHWKYFDYKTIKLEAKERLKEAKLNRKNIGERNQLEYWVAWAAHANAIATAALLAASAENIRDELQEMKKQRAE